MSTPSLPTWKRKRFSLPEGIAPVTCTTLTAHPWALGVGQKQATGHYLSPENALKHLTEKLSQAQNYQDVLVMMLTANTLNDFIQTLNQAATCFPLPELTKISRKAQSMAQLAISKMQLPSQAGGLPQAAPLSLSTARAAAGAEMTLSALQQAKQPQTPESLAQMLFAFTQARQNALTQAQSQLNTLQSGYFPVWVHSTEKDTQLARARLLSAFPDGDRVFTLAILFIGDDLAPLRQMVQHDDNTTD